LHELGIPVPRTCSKLKFLLKVLKVRRLIASKGGADNLDLPLVQDTKSAMAIRLLVTNCRSNLLQEKIVPSLYAALLATELTIRDGVSSYSAYALVVYGMIETLLRNLDRGIKFGDLALELTRRIHCKDSECLALTINTCTLLHWKMTVREIVPIMFEAMNGGFDVGNVVSSSFCVGNLCLIRYALGENLGRLEEFVHESTVRISSLSEDGMHRYAQPFMQFVVNMRGSGRTGKDVTELSGDIMDENEYMRAAVATKNRVGVMSVWSCKSILAFHFGCYDLADCLYKRMESMSERYPYGMGGPHFYFHGAMIFYERFRATRHRRHLRLVRKYRNDLLRFEAAGSPNVKEFLILLKAEEVSMKSKDCGALVTAYTAAIDAMKEARFVHLESLANERLSTVLSLLGHHELSESYLDRALELCHDPYWGSSTKHEWLLEKRNTARSKLYTARTRGRVTMPLEEIQIL